MEPEWPELTVILSGDCAHCISFATQYKEYLEAQGSCKKHHVKRIIVDDLTDTVVRALLDVWGVRELPALLLGAAGSSNKGQATWKVHTGEEAFNKMREVTCSSAESFSTAVMGTPLRELARKQCQAAALQYDLTCDRARFRGSCCDAQPPMQSTKSMVARAHN